MVGNVAWWVSGHVFRMVVTFFVGFWVVRYLGPAAFGELSVIRAVQGILNVVATIGLTQILPVRLASSESSAGSILVTAGLVRFCGATVAAAALIPILCGIQGYGMEDSGMLVVAALLLLVSPLELLDAWFVAQGKSRITAKCRMFSVVVTAALQVLAIRNGLGVLSFLAIDFVGSLVFGISLVVAMLAFAKPEGTASLDFEAARRLLWQSAPVWFSAVATIVSVRVDQGMLGMMLGDTAAGFYAAAARLSEFWFFIPVAVITNAIPALTRNYAGSRTSYSQNVLRVSSVLTSFSVTVAVGTTVTAHALVQFLFGSEFREAADVLVLHIWSLPFLALSYLSYNLRIIHGQKVSLLSRTVLAAVSNVLLNLFLIPVYGIKGAAWATLLSYVIGGIGWDLLIDRSHELGQLQVKSFFPNQWMSAARIVLLRLRTVTTP